MADDAMNTWVSLETFKVQHKAISEDRQVARVFRNGYAQVEVRILIRARDASGTVVQIPESDLRRIELIEYHSGQELDSSRWRQDAFSAGYLEYPEWLTAATAEDLGATQGEPEAESDAPILSWEALRAELGLGQDSGTSDTAIIVSRDEHDNEILTQQITRWVRTSDSTQTRIAAKIVSPQGVPFTTNDPSVPGGGGSGGKFNSSIIIDPRPEPSLTLSNYHIEEVRVYGSSDAWVRVDNYYITASLLGRQLKLRSANFQLSLWKSGLNEWKCMSTCTYMVHSNGSLGLNVPDAYTKYHAPLHNFIQNEVGVRNPREGAVIIVQCIFDAYSLGPHWDTMRTSMDYEARDEYGILHRFTLKFWDQSYRYLDIQK